MRTLQDQAYQRTTALAAEANRRVEAYDAKLEKQYQDLLKQSEKERVAFSIRMRGLFEKQIKELSSLRKDFTSWLWSIWVGQAGDWLDTGMEALIALSRGTLNFFSLGYFGKFQDKFGPKTHKYNKTIAKYTEIVADTVAIVTGVGAAAKYGVKYLLKKAVKKSANDLTKAAAGTAKQTSKEITKQTAKHGAKYFDDLARQATKNLNSTKLVLGKTFKDSVGYGKVANHFKATYFKLKNYRKLLEEIGPKAMWEINKAFLKQQLKLGKEIILSHDPAKATFTFLKEIELLERLGYKFVKDGWFWRAIK